jgi:HSP20 family protein
MPHLDFSESRDAFIIRIDLPGVQSEDVSIEVAGGNVQIKGQIPTLAAGDDVRVRRSERPSGPFQRLIPLPRQADAESVNASMSNGVLSVTMKKQVPAGGRIIPIE